MESLLFHLNTDGAWISLKDVDYKAALQGFAGLGSGGDVY